MTDAELVALIPEWLAATRETRAQVGLSRDEAVEAARKLLPTLCDRSSDLRPEFGDEQKDVIEALVRVVLPATEEDHLIERADLLYQRVSQLRWEKWEAEERIELLKATAAIGWRSVGLDLSTLLWLRKHSGDPDKPVEESELARYRDILAANGGEKSLWHLFQVCEKTVSLVDSSAPGARLAAVRWMAKLERTPALGLFDERIYFRAELARCAASACRVEGRFEEAENWLEMAEEAFANTLDPAVGLAKVAYSRLALLCHRYRYREVLENARPLAGVFERLGMHSYAEKSKLVEAIVLKSIGRHEEAATILERVVDQPEIRKRPLLRGRVLTYLGDAYKLSGRAADAARVLREALHIFPSDECSVRSAEIKFLCADFLREEQEVQESAVLFAKAKADYHEVGMLGFAAYAAVLLAETLLMLDRSSEAEEELRWALPILQQQQRLESCGAIALLQESIRRRQVDSCAVRELRESLKLRS